MATASEGQVFSNVSTNQGPFNLKGGRYLVEMIATWNSGNITLDALGPDGTTFLTVNTLSGGTSGAAKLSANGTFVVDLPPGEYRFTITTATAAYLALASVPG